MPPTRWSRQGREGPFPLGVLAINLAGTLVVGIAAGAALGGEAMTILAGGVTGSFTTFSGWMLDTNRLAEEGLDRIARLNLGVSLVAGFVAVALGHLLGTAL